MALTTRRKDSPSLRRTVRLSAPFITRCVQETDSSCGRGGKDRCFCSNFSLSSPFSLNLRHRAPLPDDRHLRSLSLVNRSVSFPSTGLSAVHFSPLPAFLFLSSPSLPLLIFTRPLDTPQPHSQSQPCPPRLLLQLPSIQESASFVVK